MKLSHDPRNLQWSDNANSFGQKIMQSSGWKPGTALGASSVPIPAHEASAAKVRIAVKDNMLGLGASLKSKNVEHQRTGLDAFQGLLGRLNAKSEADVKKVEAKVENKKLAMFVQGRWGGMVFVPGGLLVQEDPKKEDTSEQQSEENDSDSEAINETSIDVAVVAKKRKSRAEETPSDRAIRKAEKQHRKADRAVRREAKRLRRLQKEAQSQSSTNTATPDLTETETTGTSTPISIAASITSITKEPARGGRSVLRGRNILAKRAAFSDMKGLDQIFMIQQKQAA